MSSLLEPANDPTLGLQSDVPPGIPQPEVWEEFGTAADPEDGYGEMLSSVRRFLDHVAAARPDHEMISKLRDDLDAWSDTLATVVVGERDQYFARRFDLPDHGQCLAPRFAASEFSPDRVVGVTRFGRFHLGGNGAVHGGVIPLLFDEVLGWLATSGGRQPCRTAYLHVDYRSITPIGRELQVHAEFTLEEGRKRFLRGTLMDGDVLCAEVEGLFVELKPGQP
jgi:hypothetical protein